MRGGEFYKTYNLEKYPNGRLNQCKKCVTMHVDNWNPDTYTWILQECDVPYIPKEWNKLMVKYAKDPAKVTGSTILGRYLGKMQLSQWCNYRWKDNDFIEKMEEHQIEQTMKRQGYENIDIAQVLSVKDDCPVPRPAPPQQEPVEDYFDKDDSDDEELTKDLTEEDLKFLKLKWGKPYKPIEWVRLEQLYNEMTQSYDIQGAGHEDVLKLVCKTSLKANQLLDIGDKPKIYVPFKLS
jgi:hypothetical protein